MNADLPYLAALLGLGTLDADSMKSAVDSLMNEGFYADECLEALDSEPARVSEVLPAFKAALAHYGVVVPDRELAVWQVLEHHLSGSVSLDRDPWSCLCGLVHDLYWEYDFHSKATQYVGDSHGIHHLIGLYWEIDDQAGESGLPLEVFKPSGESLLAIRRTAEQWLNAHAGKHAA